MKAAYLQVVIVAVFLLSLNSASADQGSYRLFQGGLALKSSAPRAKKKSASAVKQCNKVAKKLSLSFRVDGAQGFVQASDSSGLNLTGVEDNSRISLANISKRDQIKLLLIAKGANKSNATLTRIFSAGKNVQCQAVYTGTLAQSTKEGVAPTSQQSCSFNGQALIHGQSTIAYQSSSVPAGSSCRSETRVCNNGTLSGSFNFATCGANRPQACLFNGRTIPSGQIVTAYQNATEPFGSICFLQTRLCTNGTLSGTYSHATCNISAPVACTFNGRSIPHQAAVTAFKSSNVPAGSSCQSETRICNNGDLTGSFTSANCTVDRPADCVFNGEAVPSGQSVTAYQNESVPFGSSCVEQTRLCTNGTLSGTFSHADCDVLEPAACTFNGQSVAHQASVIAYENASVPFGSTCVNQTRVCTNGTLSGTYAYPKCTVSPPLAPCTFNGQSVADRASVTAYQSSSVPVGSSCQLETRVCNNGTLSGSFNYASCAVNGPIACLFNGLTVTSGQSVTAYQNPSVPFGSTCVNQTRLCTNGALSGTYANSSCTVSAPASCTFNGQSVAHQASVTAYHNPSVPFGSTCVNQTRVCTNGNLSGTYANASCVVSPSAPFILTQPVAQTKEAGSQVTFTLSTNGTQPITYQWRKNGVEIQGATSASLILSDIQASDAGSYSVKLTNAIGSITSNAAALTVTAIKAKITTQPTSVSSYAGSKISFTVTATGTKPFTYQWMKGATVLTGQINPTLALSNIQSSDAGNYAVKITNSVGVTTSQNALLTVTAAPIMPTISTHPTSQTKAIGTNALLTVIATGNYLSYQWMQDGIALVGETSAVLNINKVQSADAGNYSVRVSNPAGSVISNLGTLTVTKPASVPTILAQPVSLSLNYEGARAEFKVSASGSGTLSYQWKKDGDALPGQTQTTLAIPNIQASDVGQYSVTVSNATGNVVSSAATLKILNGSCDFEGDSEFFTLPHNFSCYHGLRGNILQTAIDPSGTIYAATDSGLTIIRDNGNYITTKTTADGLMGNSTSAVEVGPNGNVYVGNGQGVSVSSNAGEQFTSQFLFAAVLADGTCSSVLPTTGFAFESPNAFALAPDGDLYFSTSSFVVKTTNNGRTYCDAGRSIYPKFDSTGHWDINGIRFKGSQAFIATTSGLYIVDRSYLISTPTTQTYFQKTIADGLPSNNVMDITFDPSGRVYVATDKGIAVSQSLDQRFTQSLFPLANQPVVSKLEISPLDSKIYAVVTGEAAGIYSSIDHGAHFVRESRFDLAGLPAKNIKISNSGKIVINTASMLGISDNNGLTFTTINSVSNYVAGKSVKVNTNGIIFVTAGNSIFASSNSGAVFSLRHSEASGPIPGRLFIFNNEIYAPSNNGILISRDSGVSFVRKIVSNQANSNMIRHIFVDYNGTIYASSYDGLAISRNRGESFVILKDHGLISNNIMSSYVASDGKIYVGHAAGLSVSEDNGNTFRTLIDKHNDPSNNFVTDIAVNSEGSIFAATPKGVQVSHDQGQTFVLHTINANSAVSFEHALGIDSNDKLYLATDDGLYLSEDQGVSFSGFGTNHGLPSKQVFDLAFGPDGKTYLATAEGLARSK